MSGANRPDVSSLMITERNAALLVGALCSIVAFGPLLGPIFGAPSSALSLLALPMAAILACLAGIAPMPKKTLSVCALFLVVMALAVAHASPSQFAYLLDPPWADRATRYVDSKLLMSGLGFFPAALAGLVLVSVRDRSAAMSGAMFGVAALATWAAVAAILPNAHLLIRTDLLTAHQFYKADHPFSVVSYGILIASGSIAALRFRFGWMWAGILLFSLALLNRRADTLFLLAALLTIFAALTVSRRRPHGIESLGAVLLGIALFAALHNGHNEQHFSGLITAVSHRVEMIHDAFWGNKSQASVLLNAPHQVARAMLPVAGNGLGSYQGLTGSRFEYPHNILVEVLFELGPVALLAFMTALIIPTLPVLVSVLRRSAKPDQIVFLALLAIILAIALKAGDLSSMGRIAFAAIVLSTMTTAVSPRRHTK